MWYRSEISLRPKILSQAAIWAASPALAMALLIGCYNGSNQSRGNLSDVMEKASDKNTGSREVKTEPQYPICADSIRWRPDTLNGRIIYKWSPEKERIYESSSDAFLQSLGLLAGTGTLHSRDFYGLSIFGLSYEVMMSESGHTRLDFNGRVAFTPIQQTSHLNESLDGGVGMLQLGIDVNRFTTPEYTFLGHYLFVGAQYTYMMWTYRHTVITSDGQKIKYDGLSGVDLSVGMGLNLVQARWFNIGLEVAPGAMIWNTTTSEGFHNDVFHPFTYLQLNATIKLNVARED